METWTVGGCPPRFLLCKHGLFIDEGDIKGVKLTDEEWEEWLNCPSGDPSLPIITFPCTLKDLQEGLESIFSTELIPPFAMADWVGRKLGSRQSGVHQEGADTTSPMDESNELKALEALGLLMESLAQQHPGLYAKAPGIPKKSGIYSIMIGLVEGYDRDKKNPIKIHGFAKSTLNPLLGHAIDLWEQRKQKGKG